MLLFSKIIGNDLAKSALMRMLQKGMTHHCLILSGPPGIGKKLFAIDMAKGILGHAHARKIEAMNHPDVRVFSPEGKSGMHSIVTLKQLQEQMALEPFEADARVFIIEEADRMQPVASNSLLKTLEEPPKNNYFILLTSQPDDILPTIHSRSRFIPFFLLQEKEIYQYLKEHHQLSDSEIKKIAFLAHGSLQKAFELIKDPQDSKRKLLIDLLVYDFKSVCEMAHHISKIEEALSKDSSDEGSSLTLYTEVDHLFEQVLYWYRDLHLIKSGVSPDFVFHLDYLQALQARAGSSLPSLEEVFSCIEECRLALHRSMKIKNVFEYLFSKLMVQPSA